MAKTLGPDKTLGVACLGITHPHTSGRVQAVQRLPNARMLGAADDSPLLGPFVEALGMKARSKKEILEDPDVHVVYVHSKSYAMADLTIEALEAGKAVLCEKPFTLNRREAEAAVALARRHDVFLMEAMWMRFVPAMVELKRLVAEGAIGEPVSVSADFGFASTGLPASHRVLAPALGGGGLLDIGIYPLNFAAFVLGEITGVQADAALGPTGVDVHTVFNLRHAGGRLSQGMCSLRSTTGCHATVLGTDGRIVVSPPFYAAQQLQLARGTRPWEETPVEVIDRPWRGSRYVAQVEEVHRCLRAGLSESPVMTLDETVALVGWMDTMRAQFGLRYPGE